MKKFVVVLALFSTVLPLAAGISSGLSAGPMIVVARSEPRTVPVCLVMPADFVSAPVRVISDQKDAALAYEELGQALEMISSKAKENGQLRTSMGVVSLSRHTSGFGLSSGSWSQPAASAEICLLVPFTKERADMFGAGAEAARFLASLRLPGKAHCELGELQLAVEDPEQHRPALLQAIAQDVKKTRDTMASGGTARVDGLERAVVVRQADDRQVELFLNYSLSIATDK